MFEIALRCRKEVISMLRGIERNVMGREEKRERKGERKLGKCKSPGIFKGMRKSKSHSKTKSECQFIAANRQLERAN